MKLEMWAPVTGDGFSPAFGSLGNIHSVSDNRQLLSESE